MGGGGCLIPGTHKDHNLQHNVLTYTEMAERTVSGREHLIHNLLCIHAVVLISLGACFCS